MYFRIHSYAIMALASLVMIGSASAGPIPWRSGAREVQAQSPAEVETALLHSLAAHRSGAPERVLVQFDQPVEKQLRTLLAANGLQLLNYVGENAFFAAISPQDLDISTLSRMPALYAIESIWVEWKLHPLLLAGQVPIWAVVGTDIDGAAIVGAYLLFHRDVDLQTEGIPLVESYGIDIRDVLESVNGLVIELPADLIPILAIEDAVQWIEPPLPRFSTTNNSNRARVQAEELWVAPYNLSGAGVTVLVYDAGTARASHLDFGGRLTVHDDSNMNDHPTHVAGTIGGSGLASGGKYAGMAPGVTLLSYGFQWDGNGIFFYNNPGDIESDYYDAINTHGADISNNSIGSNVSHNENLDCRIIGDYGVTDQLIDTIVRGDGSNPKFTEPFRIVWSAGNERGGEFCVQAYFKMAPPACAKNHITVGALNSGDDQMTDFSSWGPTDDGRMKPDICGPGCQLGGDRGVTSCSYTGDSDYTSMCGTSMSGPTIAGCAALLLEDYRTRFESLTDPRNSTLKVLLAHSAVDLGNWGPDYKFGYGSVRARDAVDLMRTGQFFEAQVEQDEIYSIAVMVDPGESELKATLAWDDYPATPNIDIALINDLDLRAVDPDGRMYNPWTLDPDKPAQPAVQTVRNQRDNIEQVVVLSPTPGLWRLDVRGYNIPEGPQVFSLVTSPGFTDDCNGNGTPDGQDVDPNDPDGDNLISLDCNDNGLPDECEPDCNNNGLPDRCDITSGTSIDCNGNIMPDECDLVDCDGSLWCSDCNGNSVPDTCDLASQNSSDCNANSVPDECEPDCNSNGVTDECDITAGTSEDCNGNVIPDECDRANCDGSLWCGDCQSNGIMDVCEPTPARDNCADAIIVCPNFAYYGSTNSATNDGTASCGESNDTADVWYYYQPDGYGGAIISLCGSTYDTVLSVHSGCPGTAGNQIKCNDDYCGQQSRLSISINPNGDGYWIRISGADGSTGRFRMIISGQNCAFSPECNDNGIPDECEPDCNGNGQPDECDITDAASLDENGNGFPDECELAGDLDCDGIISEQDIDLFVMALVDPAAYRRQQPNCNAINADCNLDGNVNSLDIDPFIELLIRH